MPVSESITVCSDDERATLKRDITVVSCCRSNSRGGRQKDTDDGCARHRCMAFPRFPYCCIPSGGNTTCQSKVTARLCNPIFTVMSDVDDA